MNRKTQTLLEVNQTPHRAPLRSDARAKLLERILQGQLVPGQRINESQLALELGLSRTPLREALMTLEREGLVQSNLNRGFIVCTLSSREAREIYPILWTLEGLALHETGLLVTVILPDLKRINDELAQPNLESNRAVQLDTAFHESLISRCPNMRLLELIRRHRQLLARYEHLQMSDSSLVEHSVVQHASIIQALGQHEISAAVSLLEQNWRFGSELMLSQMQF